MKPYQLPFAFLVINHYGEIDQNILKGRRERNKMDITLTSVKLNQENFASFFEASNNGSSDRNKSSSLKGKDSDFTSNKPEPILEEVEGTFVNEAFILNDQNVQATIFSRGENQQVSGKNAMKPLYEVSLLCNIHLFQGI